MDFDFQNQRCDGYFDYYQDIFVWNNEFFVCLIIIVDKKVQGDGVKS